MCVSMCYLQMSKCVKLTDWLYMQRNAFKKRICVCVCELVSMSERERNVIHGTF